MVAEPRRHATQPGGARAEIHAESRLEELWLEDTLLELQELHFPMDFPSDRSYRPLPAALVLPDPNLGFQAVFPVPL